MRTLFEPEGADHVLHLLEASDDECLASIHLRNAEKPAGVYYGDVSDELFHAVTAHFVPPADDEGFHVVRVARRR